MTDASKIVKELRQNFSTGCTLPVEWRLHQLSKIMKMLTECQQEIEDALVKDLHRPKNEAMFFEVVFARKEALDAIISLKEWMEPEKVDRGLLNIMDDCFVKPEPLGVVLIMGAWNYPFQLCILPLIGAIAAGNCAVVKPSELAPHSAEVITRLLHNYLDSDCIKVYNGGIPETQELLQERFDHIFYTGSSRVGKIIMKSAAEHLTPVTLELGGKCPAYIDDDCNLQNVANRILWGKTVNCGQICIAPDYVMCSKELQGPFVEKLIEAFEMFYSDSIHETKDYGRIIHKKHFQHLKELVGNRKPAFGGEFCEESLLITPTILTDITPDDPLMQEEIFGPILPIMTVENEDEAIQYIKRGEKPLSLYVFSSNKETVNKFLSQTTSGGVCINDVIVHGGLATLPFGGVGQSGMGSYHGKFTFETFSHKKAVMWKSMGMENVNSLRYPPYSDEKCQLFTWFVLMRPGLAKKFLTALLVLLVALILSFIFMKVYGPSYGSLLHHWNVADNDFSRNRFLKHSQGAS
ncbi:aldehyde dehydrogenase, dimeric NADP-preferring [Octopus sinensis]|uniref:Aldehyde dehydrogenase n=1 Tax=Octopus sinensis TaxID=2607531 RepID=A0A6P7S5T6_9MOLL|nr:aldehyde dehydrogenase, dimeric NADP-preferring [Octopus sinensis]